MICAHSLNVLGERHDLVTHLREVAKLAREFAVAFPAADPAYYLGLWHDLGKFHPDFQAYLDRCDAAPSQRGRGPDHKAAGASLAARHLGPLALAIQGHHGGLQCPADFQTWFASLASGAAVAESLGRARQAIADLEPGERLPLPAHVARERRAGELYLRLLFSALVDADYLDTESHFQPEQAARRAAPVELAALWDHFAADQAERYGSPSETAGLAGAVSAARRTIYEACLAAAERPPGLFRLTVPTGGGKTRSAMAFALRHAKQHGQQRVIVAVPFITITEQTAGVYREAFGAGSDAAPVVLEHHSGAAADARESEDFLPEHVWARLAAENWDAPIVVTTTVQLFESLFGYRTSSSRKVHRLANSVIILDEAQALPAGLLTPILDALRELCAHYGTTVVLSTATQPTFETIPAFADLAATEIVPEPERFFATLRRVEYEWRTATPVSWDEVAEQLRAEPQALAIVNTKKDALALLDALDDPDTLHLSTLLCSAHRRQTVADIRERLKNGEPCRLVSTQVIEAGVDLDFPLVLRALAPLDGIIQAAGRCNREGRQARGRVIVFNPAEGGSPPGDYQIGIRETAALLGEGYADPDDPAMAREYFRRLYDTLRDTDKAGVQQFREELNFPEVARRFQMIDDEPTMSVVVPYGTEEQQEDVTALLARLRAGAPDARAIRRRLQPYLVSLRGGESARYQRQGFITEIAPGLGQWHGGYDPVRGLTPADQRPDALVV